MASQTDLDQGGTERKYQNIWLGPSVGWISVPVSSLLEVRNGGTVQVARGMTVIAVSAAAAVTVQLPPAEPPVIAAGALPGDFAGIPVIVLDVAGNATATPITILPAAGELIDGAASATIGIAYGVCSLFPSTSNGTPGWVIKSGGESGGGSGVVLSIDTIATDLPLLQRVEDGEIIFVRGYHTAYDGGGGELIYSFTSTAAIDNGTVFNGPLGVGRYIRLLPTDDVDLMFFGPFLNSDTDSQAQVLAWITYIVENSKCGRAPAGYISMDSVASYTTNTVSTFSIRGEGNRTSEFRASAINTTGCIAITAGLAFGHISTAEFTSLSFKPMGLGCGTALYYSIGPGVASVFSSRGVILRDIYIGTNYNENCYFNVGITTPRVGRPVFDTIVVTGNNSDDTFTNKVSSFTVGTPGVVTLLDAASAAWADNAAITYVPDPAGTPPTVEEDFTGDGSTTLFLLGIPVGQDSDAVVTVNGVLQVLGTDYTMPALNKIQFVTAPAAAAAIVVLQPLVAGDYYVGNWNAGTESFNLCLMPNNVGITLTAVGTGSNHQFVIEDYSDTSVAFDMDTAIDVSGCYAPVLNRIQINFAKIGIQTYTPGVSSGREEGIDLTESQMVHCITCFNWYRTPGDQPDVRIDRCHFHFRDYGLKLRGLDYSTVTDCQSGGLTAAHTPANGPTDIYISGGSMITLIGHKPAGSVALNRNAFVFDGSASNIDGEAREVNNVAIVAPMIEGWVNVIANANGRSIGAMSNIGIYNPSIDGSAFTIIGPNPYLDNASALTVVQSGWNNQNPRTTQIQRFDPDAAASPIIDWYRNSTTIGIGDILAKLQFTGNNSALAQVTYAYAQALINAKSAGSEGGALTFGVVKAGVQTDRFQLMDSGAALLQSYLQLDEITTPSAPAANQGLLYIKDNGSGITELMFQPSTGGEQIIAPTNVSGLGWVSDYATAQTTFFAAQIKETILGGYYSFGDGGGAKYVRYSSQPSFPASFRSTDRFLPDGSISSANGGWWGIAEEIISVLMLGAKGDATQNVTTGAWSGTDDTTAFVNTELTSEALKCPRYMPAGAYILTGAVIPFNTALSNVCWFGDGPETKVIYKFNASIWSLEGVTDGNGTVACYLTAAAAVGTRQLTVNDTSSLQVDQYIVLNDNSQKVFYGFGADQTWACNTGQVVRIKSIDSAVQVTLYDQLEFTFGFNITPALSTTLRRYINEAGTASPYCNATFRDFDIWVDPTNAVTGTTALISVQRYLDLYVRNITVHQAQCSLLSISDIIRFKFFNLSNVKSLSDANYYGIAIDGCSTDGMLVSIYQEGGRHLMTTTSSPGQIENSHCSIVNCIGKEQLLTTFDVHGGVSRHFNWVNCQSHAGNFNAGIGTGEGFQLRGRWCTVVGAEVSGQDTGISLAFGNHNQVIGGNIRACRIGLGVTNAYSETVRDVRIFDSIQYGIFIDADAAGTPYPGLRFDRIEITGNPSTAGVFNNNVTQGDDWYFNVLFASTVVTKWSGINATAQLNSGLYGKSYVVAASAVAASHTGDTTETALATVDIPAGVMGLNGRLEIETLWSYTNNANTKTQRIRFGGITGTQFLAINATSTATARLFTAITNAGAANSQKGWAFNNGSFGSSAGALVTGTLDTTADQSLAITGQLGVATDTITLEAYVVKLILPN